MTDNTDPLMKFKNLLPAETGRLNARDHQRDAGQQQVHTKQQRQLPGAKVPATPG